MSDETVTRRLLHHTNEVSVDQETVIRTRAKAEYGLAGALDIYASAEPLFEPGADYLVHEWRHTVGFQFEYAKNKRLDLLL